MRKSYAAYINIKTNLGDKFFTPNTCLGEMDLTCRVNWHRVNNTMHT